MFYDPASKTTEHQLCLILLVKAFTSRPRCEGEEHGPSPFDGRDLELCFKTTTDGAPVKGSGVGLGCELGINQSIAGAH